MVKKALEHSNCAANIEKVYDFYPRFWSEPSQYTQLGLAAPMPRHKEYHLNQVCHDFNVQMSEIVLIDDDIHNCKNAKKIGAAVLYVKGAGFDLTEVDLI
nr:p36 protein [Babesia bovis]